MASSFQKVPSVSNSIKSNSVISLNRFPPTRFINHNIERNSFRKQIATFVDEERKIMYGNAVTARIHFAQSIGLEAWKQKKRLVF